MHEFDRREFLMVTAGLGVSFFIGGCGGNSDPVQHPGITRTPKFNINDLAIATGKNPAKNTRAAVDALGGMKKLVKKGDFVVIKPNMTWNRPPEAAANTNPLVVAEIVLMCLEAGAGKVLVIEHICDKPLEAVMVFSGIKPAAEKAGAIVSSAQNASRYQSVAIPKGRAITFDTCIKDILNADVFINVPIAKSHSATKLTLGMKNLMGCNWDRQAWHQNTLEQCIADYVTAIRPDLTILDANRILLTNGPKGPGETRDVNQVIASVDPVAVDAYGATIFNLKPEQIGYIKLAYLHGVGEMDLKKMTIKTEIV